MAIVAKVPVNIPMLITLLLGKEIVTLISLLAEFFIEIF
jgi:hypothetical protein